MNGAERSKQAEEYLAFLQETTKIWCASHTLTGGAMLIGLIAFLVAAAQNIGAPIGAVLEMVKAGWKDPNIA